MSKRGITLADLPAAAREQATRQVSRQLAQGNGETVAPQPTFIPKAAPPTQVVTQWWRTAAKGSQIVPVEVVAAGKGWLDILVAGDVVQRTRTDGEAEFYHQTRAEAVRAVYERLCREKNTTDIGLEEFQQREAETLGKLA